MRESLQCPKCQHRKIWHIEQARQQHQNADGAVIPVILKRAVGPVSTGFFSEGERSEITMGHYDVFICAACGYSEWYAKGLDDLEENPGEGVSLLDGDEGTQVP